MQPVGNQFGYDEASSQTQESASAQALKPIPTRPQDKGKFVARWDEAAISHIDLTKKIDKIASALQTSRDELKAIEEAIQFRRAKPEDFGKFSQSLIKINDVLDVQAQKLHGVSGVVKHTATLQDTQVIPAIFCRVQELEIDLLLSQKSKRKLEALCESDQFISTYKYVKGVIPSLFAVVATQDAPIFDKFIQSIDEIIKTYVEPISPRLKELFEEKPNKQKVDAFVAEVDGHIEKPLAKQEKIKQNSKKELYLEMLQASLVLARAIFSEKRQGKNQTTARLNWRIRILETLCKHAKAGLPKSKPQESQERPAVEILRQGYCKDFSFWKAHQTKSYWHKIGYYPQTGAMATAMEDNIGQLLGGLLVKLREHLREFSKGNFSENFQQECTSYWLCLRSLEETFNSYFEQSCRTLFDDLTQDVLDYAHGIRYAFSQSKSLLKLAEKCSSGPARRVFEAIHGLKTHYEKQDYSTTFEQTLGLSSAILTMKEAEKNRPGHATSQLTALLRNTLDVLNEIHAQKSPELLRVTIQETASLQWILGKKPLEALYEQNEARQTLPLVVMNYISKRAMQFLYLPSDMQDIELELLLHALKNEYPALYRHSLQAQTQFEALLTAYDTASLSFRLSSEKLSHLTTIAEHTIRSQDLSGSVFDYGQAWQLLFEFLRKNKGEHADAAAKVLTGYLTSAAAEKNYPPIYATVAKRDNETWPIDENEFHSHIQQAYEETRLQVPDISQQQVFNAVVLRMLCASCYAAETEEQINAHKQLIQLFRALAESEYMGAIPEPLRQMIRESTCEKVLACSFEDEGGENMAITHAELLQLLQGPIEEFFTSASWSYDKIELVIFKLIQSEFFSRGDKPLKNRFIEEKGEMAFHRWFNNFESFLSGNPIARLRTDGLESE